MVWICTDPDTFQYRANTPNAIVFKQFNVEEFPELFKELYDGDLEYDHKTIVESTMWRDYKYWKTSSYKPLYTLKEMEEVANAYGYTLTQLANMEDGNNLLYEFIFEQS